MASDFHGAKAAIFLGDDLLVYQRDSHVVWPDHWDFPGGGREGNETPFDCLSREVREEFGLTISYCDVLWERQFPSMIDPRQSSWFFVVRQPAEFAQSIRFGSEGQRWALMPLADVAQLPNLVPALRDRLMLWLRESGHAPI